MLSQTAEYALRAVLAIADCSGRPVVTPLRVTWRLSWLRWASRSRSAKPDGRRRTRRSVAFRGSRFVAIAYFEVAAARIWERPVP